MTMKEAKAILDGIGWTIKKQDGEYRIHPKGKGELDCFETDIEAAVGTAQAQAARGIR